MTDDRPEHLTTTEVRAGTGPRDMRYVLGVGLVLVVVIFAAILLWAG
jgi:hypothetical protein